MYLNMNLTIPPGEGSCTTPKTPEILNSLISLTSPQHFNTYQNQVTGDLLSPVSTVSTPGEEFPSSLGHHERNRCSKRHYSGSSSDGGGSGLTGGSPATSVGCGPLVGATPPATPDLPSPVNTVQATKTALIKEGLKHQIKSKLHAAGVGPEEILSENKAVKEELTTEDAERRRRRRERNKIAATKCRNKKKEKTFILMSSLFQESEQVEDQNVKLKSELERLTSEKLNLEKLLGDPTHRASCRHSNRACSLPQTSSESSVDSKMPSVLVTPPEVSDASSTSAAVTRSGPCVSTNACSVSHYCNSVSVSSHSSCSGPQSLISEISPSITTLSPPLNTLSPPCSTDSAELSFPKSPISLSLSLSSSCISMASNSLTCDSEQLNTVMSSVNQGVKNLCDNMSMHQLVSQHSASISHPSQFSPVKSASHSMGLRHQPYQYPANHQHVESLNYGGNCSSQMGSLPQHKQYCSQVNNSNMLKYYEYPKTESTFPSNDFTVPDPPSKNNYLAPKSRAANMARYHPYTNTGRVSNSQAIETSNNPQLSRNLDTLEIFDPSSGCGQQRIENSYVNDQQQNIYFSYL